MQLQSMYIQRKIGRERTLRVTTAGGQATESPGLFPPQTPNLSVCAVRIMTI